MRAGTEQRPASNGERLVGDVRLVEGGSPWHRLGGEAVPVPGRGNRRCEIRRVVRLARPARVRREVRDGEEERLRARGEPLHGVDRLRRVHVGLVVAGRSAVANELAVLVQRVVVELIRARVDGAEPLVPARRNLRRPLPSVAVQVLADVHRVVPGQLQPGGQRVRVRGRELLVAALRQRVPHHGVVVAVLPGEEGGARGAAERERDVVVGERRPLRAEHGVHVRHHAHRLDRLVVGHHDDDVRSRRRRFRGGAAARSGREGGEQRNADDRPEQEDAFHHGLHTH